MSSVTSQRVEMEVKVKRERERAKDIVICDCDSDSDSDSDSDFDSYSWPWQHKHDKLRELDLWLDQSNCFSPPEGPGYATSDTCQCYCHLPFAICHHSPRITDSVVINYLLLLLLLPLVLLLLWNKLQ